jgi:hypothetical protein
MQNIISLPSHLLQSSLIVSYPIRSNNIDHTFILLCTLFVRLPAYDLATRLSAYSRSALEGKSLRLVNTYKYVYIHIWIDGSRGHVILHACLNVYTSVCTCPRSMLREEKSRYCSSTNASSCLAYTYDCIITLRSIWT